MANCSSGTGIYYFIPISAYQRINSTLSRKLFCILLELKLELICPGTTLTDHVILFSKKNELELPAKELLSILNDQSYDALFSSSSGDGKEIHFSSILMMKFKDW